MIMNFIFAKLFEEYLRKNDSPTRRITIYISIFYFFLTFAIILPIKTFIDKKIFNNQLHYENKIILVALFVILTIITFIVHYVFIRNNYIYSLIAKYKSIRINTTILYLIIVLTPVVLLLFAGLITVLFNGGEILGNKIEGFLH
jgi:hypothetical protein